MDYEEKQVVMPTRKTRPVGLFHGKDVVPRAYLDGGEIDDQLVGILFEITANPSSGIECCHLGPDGDERIVGRSSASIASWMHQAVTLLQDYPQTFLLDEANRKIRLEMEGYTDPGLENLLLHRLIFYSLLAFSIGLLFVFAQQAFATIVQSNIQSSINAIFTGMAFLFCIRSTRISFVTLISAIHYNRIVLAGGHELKAEKEKRNRISKAAADIASRNSLSDDRC